jgi:hypothetical protein
VVVHLVLLLVPVDLVSPFSQGFALVTGCLLDRGLRMVRVIRAVVDLMLVVWCCQRGFHVMS